MDRVLDFYNFRYSVCYFDFSLYRKTGGAFVAATAELLGEAGDVAFETAERSFDDAVAFFTEDHDDVSARTCGVEEVGNAFYGAIGFWHSV